MKKVIVFIATGWGPKSGGINSLNYDLCINTGELNREKADVFCITPDAEQSDISEAKESGITLISLDDKGANNYKEEQTKIIWSLLHEKGIDVVDYWVGHDIMSGIVGMKLKNISGCGSLVVFHHMNYGAYESLKSKENESIRKKILKQRDLLNKSDIVIGIGPKLFKSALDIIDNSCKATVEELIPGVHDIKHKKEAPRRFSGLIYGRIDPAAEEIKQINLSICAFATTVSSSDDTLNIIGINNNTYQAELKKIAHNTSKRVFPINFSSYTNDRNELFNELSHHSIVMMLSLHEGFGLVGLEAIGARVPLILGKNSGLYEFLIRVIDKDKSYLINAIDIKGQTDDPSKQKNEDTINAGQLISDIKEHPNKYKGMAEELYELISTYTWKGAAKKFTSILHNHEEKKLDNLELFNTEENKNSSTTNKSLKNINETQKKDDIVHNLLSKTYDILSSAYPCRKIELIQRVESPKTSAFALYRLFDSPTMPLHFLFLDEKTYLRPTFESYVSNYQEKIAGLNIITPRSKKTSNKDSRKKEIDKAIRGYSKINPLMTKIYFIDDFTKSFCINPKLFVSHDMSDDLSDYCDQKIYNITHENETIENGNSREYFENKTQKEHESNNDHNTINVLLGSGGVGKSKLCDVIADIYNKRSIEHVIYIVSNDLTDNQALTYENINKNITNIYDLYELYLLAASLQNHINSSNLEINISLGNIVIIIDGLEEIESFLKEKFNIKNFLQSLIDLNSIYPNCKIYIATRDYHINIYKDLEGAKLYHLKGFTDDLVREYFKKRLRTKKKISDAINYLNQTKLKESERIIPLALKIIGDFILEDDKYEKTNASNEENQNNAKRNIPHSEMYLKLHRPLDRLIDEILGREIEKQSIELSFTQLFELLIYIEVDEKGVIKKSDLQAYINSLSDDLSDEPQNSNHSSKYFINPLFESRGDSIEMKYSVIKTLIQTRALQAMLSNKNFTQGYLPIITSYYDGKGAVLDEICESTKPDQKKLALQQIRHLLRVLIFNLKKEQKHQKEASIKKEKANPTLTLYKKAISACLYHVFRIFNISSPLQATKTLKYLYDDNLANIYIYGSFYPFDFNNCTFCNSEFYNYDNLISSKFPSHEIVFHECVFKGLKMAHNPHIPKSAFDSKTILPKQLKGYQKMDQFTAEEHYQLILKDLKGYFSRFTSSKKFEAKKYEQLCSFEFKSRLIHKEVIKLLVEKGLLVLDKQNNKYSVPKKYQSQILDLKTNNHSTPDIVYICNTFLEESYRNR